MLKTLVKRLAGVVAVAAVVSGGVLVLQEPAMAACSGYTCNNQEVTAHGCDKGTVSTMAATPWHSSVSGDWMVDMRRSSVCSARWARIQISLCWCSDQVVQMRIERRWRELTTDPYELTHVIREEAPASGTAWTKMVGDDATAAVGDDQFRVCHERRLIGSTGAWTVVCTGWVN